MKWYINVPNVWKPPTRRSLESGQWSPSPNLHPPCSPSSGWILCMELATPSGQYPIVVQSFVHQFPLPSCNTNIEIYFILPYKQSISTKIGKTTIYLEPHMSHILMARQCLLNDYIYIYILIYIYKYIDIYIYEYIYVDISSCIWFIFPSPFRIDATIDPSQPAVVTELTLDLGGERMSKRKTHEENSESLLCNVSTHRIPWCWYIC